MRDRGTKRRRGVTTVETAAVLGLCLTFLLGIFEYGRLIMMRNLVDNAAREGARQAVTGTETLTTASIQGTVTGFLGGQSLANLNIQVYPTDTSGNKLTGSWNNAAFGSGIGVQVDGDYTPLVPSFGILPSTVHLTAKSVMMSEGN